MTAALESSDFRTHALEDGEAAAVRVHNIYYSKRVMRVRKWLLSALLVLLLGAAVWLFVSLSLLFNSMGAVSAAGGSGAVTASISGGLTLAALAGLFVYVSLLNRPFKRARVSMAALRIERGIPAYIVAGALDMREADYHACESGAVILTLAELEMLANFYAVPIKDLLSLRG